MTCQRRHKQRDNYKRRIGQLEAALDRLRRSVRPVIREAMVKTGDIWEPTWDLEAHSEPITLTIGELREIELATHWPEGGR